MKTCGGCERCADAGEDGEDREDLHFGGFKWIGRIVLKDVKRLNGEIGKLSHGCLKNGISGE